MVVLSLAVLGFWLIVLVIHFEIRKRELLIAVEKQRERYQLANERLAEYRASLDAPPPEDELPLDAEDALSSGPEMALGDDFSESSPASASRNLPETLEDPTPAQIAALVAPSFDSPLETGLGASSILEEAQQVAREQPEVATAAIRRLIEQDPRPPRSPY